MYFLNVNYRTKYYAKHQEDAQYMSEYIINNQKDQV